MELDDKENMSNWDNFKEVRAAADELSTKDEELAKIIQKELKTE